MNGRSEYAECDRETDMSFFFFASINVDDEGTQDLWTDRSCSVGGQEVGISWRDGNWYRQYICMEDMCSQSQDDQRCLL